MILRIGNKKITSSDINVVLDKYFPGLTVDMIGLAFVQGIEDYSGGQKRTLPEPEPYPSMDSILIDGDISCRILPMIPDLRSGTKRAMTIIVGNGRPMKATIQSDGVMVINEISADTIEIEYK